MENLTSCRKSPVPFLFYVQGKILSSYAASPHDQMAMTVNRRGTLSVALSNVVLPLKE